MAWHTVVHLVPQCSSNGIPYYTETITTLSKAMYKTSAHYVRYNRMQRRYCLTDVNTNNPPSYTPPPHPPPQPPTIFKHKCHKPFFLDYISKFLTNHIPIDLYISKLNNCIMDSFIRVHQTLLTNFLFQSFLVPFDYYFRYVMLYDQ